MTLFDYLLNIGLIGLVLLQVRGRRLDRRALVLPLALVAWAAAQYLHGIPTAGNDLALVAALAVAGLGLGTSSALLTSLEPGRDGIPMARAGLLAATLWVLGIGARMAFSLYAQHGGAGVIGRFSISHHLTPQAWVSGLVLMAFAEVVSRTIVLWTRSRLVGDALAVVAIAR
jgi:hypothetical protein